MSHLAHLAVLCTTTLTFSLAAGAPLSAEGNLVITHVRAGDRLSGKLLRTAVASSPTLRALIAELDNSDVIVYVVARPLPLKINGITQVVVSTPFARYLRVTLKLPNAPEFLVEVLGHELQHAVEIAEMPHVRDEFSLAAAFRGIGFETLRGGFFETKRARQSGMRVAREAKVKR